MLLRKPHDLMRTTTNLSSSVFRPSPGIHVLEDTTWYNEFLSYRAERMLRCTWYQNIENVYQVSIAIFLLFTVSIVSKSIPVRYLTLLVAGRPGGSSG